MEGAREHAQQGAHHDPDERGGDRGIHGVATYPCGSDGGCGGWGSPRNPARASAKMKTVQLPLEPVDPRIGLTMVGTILGARIA